MADQPNAFEENNTATPPEGVGTPKEPTSSQNTPNVSDAFADQLMAITNEDGKPKYKSIDEALNALKHSQTFIPELKNDLDSYKEQVRKLQEELNQRESVEDVVKRLTSRQQEADPAKQDDKPKVSGLDEQTAKQLFEQLLTEKEQTRKVASNQETVNSALYEMFGDKTQEQVKKKAEELGTSPKELGELASQNPNLVLALFKTPQNKGTKPTTNSINMHNYNSDSDELKRPERSLLSGSTSKDQRDYMRQVKEAVYRKHGITS